MSKATWRADVGGGWRGGPARGAGKSRHHERLIAVVVIAVAVVHVIVSVSMQVPMWISMVITSIHVRSMIMWWQHQECVSIHVCAGA